MAEPIQWLDGQAKVTGIVEKICPKRHIRQDQWQSEWNVEYLNDRSKYCYDFISDYECIFSHPVSTWHKYFLYRELWDNLQTAKRQGTRIPILNLAHFTELPYAAGIITSGGFGERKKKINEDANGHDVKAKFSWWSPIFGKDDIELVRKTLAKAIQPILAERHDQRDNENDEEISDQEDEASSNQDNEEGVQIDEDGSEQKDDQDDEEISDQEDEACSEEEDDQDDEEISYQEDEASKDIEEGTVAMDEEGSEEDDDQDDDQDDLLTQLRKQFATSEAFNPNAQRNGNYYFQYDINDLCDCYQIHFNCELQFKQLGTFSYKKEVMYAVLVCSQENGDGLFKEYPSVLTPEEDREKNEAVVTRDKDGHWVWKPQATGSGEIRRLPDEYIRYPKYRRWDHVAFAFHIPAGWRNEAPFMTVPDLSQNVHYLLS